MFARFRKKVKINSDNSYNNDPMPPSIGFIKTKHPKISKIHVNMTYNQALFFILPPLMTEYQSFYFEKYTLSSLLYKTTINLIYHFIYSITKLTTSFYIKMTECHSYILYTNILQTVNAKRLFKIFHLIVYSLIICQ